MKFEKAREEFIRVWGELGSNWGTNKTMAQIHALLLSSSEALSTEDVMAILNISRGNANMNLRALMDWGLANKAYKPGERKDYFEADKDIWNVSKRVAEQRKKRELDPLKKALDKMTAELEPKSKEEKEFKKMLTEVQTYSHNAEKLVDKLSRSDKNWFFKLLMKLV